VSLKEGGIQMYRGISRHLSSLVKINRNRLAKESSWKLITSTFPTTFRFLSSDTIDGEQKWVLTQDPLKSEYQEEVWSPKDLSQREIHAVNRKIASDRVKRFDKGKSLKKHHIQPENEFMLSKIKGFLQLNPHICSGCGSHFQSKSPDTPGYLEKERFAEHRVKAEKLRRIQDVLKLLDMAGINPDSDVAMEMMVQAKTTPDIIEGVLDINRRMTKGIKKFSFDDELAPRHPPHSNSVSSLNEMDHLHSSGIDPSTKVEKQRIVLGYHYLTLEPIYDEETLLKSFAEEKASNPMKTSYPEKKISAEEEDLSNEIDHTTTPPIDDTLPICQRCFRLQFYGQCQDVLRPGWTANEDLTPEKFQDLLSVIRESTCVVLCLVDIFDLEGSIVPNIKQIAGKNPIVIVANKIDLLPNDASSKRVSDWIYRTIRQKCELISPKEAEELDFKEYQDKGWYKSRENNEEGILRKNNIHLVSCSTGSGLQDLMNNILSLAKTHGDKIYVMGTANVGKSSFVNRLLKYTSSNKKHATKKHSLPQATVSPLPGTTLDFLKIRLPTGVQMIDTPGLINNSQLTSRLNTKELKLVIPTKQIHHVTLSIHENYCVLIGGLAKIELVEVTLLFLPIHILPPPSLTSQSSLPLLGSSNVLYIFHLQ
jgi:30S ribosome assembly GTPase